MPKEKDMPLPGTKLDRQAFTKYLVFETAFSYSYFNHLFNDITDDCSFEGLCNFIDKNKPRHLYNELDIRRVHFELTSFVFLIIMIDLSINSFPRDIIDLYYSKTLYYLYDAATKQKTDLLLYHVNTGESKDINPVVLENLKGLFGNRILQYNDIISNNTDYSLCVSSLCKLLVNNLAGCDIFKPEHLVLFGEFYKSIGEIAGYYMLNYPLKY